MIDRTAFISIHDVPAKTGISERALRRRLAAGAVTVFKDPVDNRRRLVRESDLDRLVAPTPLRTIPDSPDAA